MDKQTTAIQPYCHRLSACVKKGWLGMSLQDRSAKTLHLKHILVGWVVVMPGILHSYSNHSFRLEPLHLQSNSNVDCLDELSAAGSMTLLSVLLLSSKAPWYHINTALRPVIATACRDLASRELGFPVKKQVFKLHFILQNLLSVLAMRTIEKGR